MGLATGAIDNGIGSFSVVDIARVFKSLHLKTKELFSLFYLWEKNKVSLVQNTW
jgi:Zn-dependent M28 family amino/carboxypeptidase